MIAIGTTWRDERGEVTVIVATDRFVIYRRGRLNFGLGLRRFLRDFVRVTPRPTTDELRRQMSDLVHDSGRPSVGGER